MTAGLRQEDSQDFEFDDNNVFSFNQLPGYDIIESGPRANVGAMAEALFPGGEVEAQLGQTYRLKPDPLLAAFTFRRHVPEGETKPPPILAQRQCVAPAASH